MATYWTPTVKNLLAVKAFFRDHPDGLVPMDWCTRYGRDEWDRFFMSCLNTKINRNEKPRGRKDSPDYEREMRHAANQLNHPRLVIHWLPPDLRERFAHRLPDPDERR